MANKAADKFIDALTNLLEGYNELAQLVAEDLGVSAEVAEDDNHELELEIQAALSTEIRAAIETVIENEDYSVEDVAMVVSNLTESIEEIDPDVFASEESEEEEEDDEDEDLDLDDEDLDFDDLDDEEDEE